MLDTDHILKATVLKTCNIIYVSEQIVDLPVNEITEHDPNAPLTIQPSYNYIVLSILAVMLHHKSRQTRSIAHSLKYPKP